MGKVPPTKGQIDYAVSRVRGAYTVKIASCKDPDKARDLTDEMRWAIDSIHLYNQTELFDTMQAILRDVNGH